MKMKLSYLAILATEVAEDAETSIMLGHEEHKGNTKHTTLGNCAYLVFHSFFIAGLVTFTEQQFSVRRVVFFYGLLNLRRMNYFP